MHVTFPIDVLRTVLLGPIHDALVADLGDDAPDAVLRLWLAAISRGSRMAM